ncbi:aminotransferase [Chromatiales bacterium (ex Bugula neritina AB1)]|nr:aminotransferase [Chromatiales bacterium (ex Bugula neritina AB1)]
MHHLHPFTDTKALNQKGARIIERAEGVYLWDTEGNRFLDGMAGLWCVNAGYGRREILDAVYQQMQQLPYYNTFFQTSHPPVIELAARVAELTPEHLNRVFFCSSGSEANDTVVRMVRHYWSAVGKPEKKVIISRENAYHGSTMAGASLGGMKPMHKQGGLPIADIEHIMQPHWFALGYDSSPEAFGVRAANALEEKIIELGAGNVAAFIAEPVQGAGGVIVPPSTYWPLIQEICTRHDVLLVADEVICGFGRTGKWFGSDQFEITADLMAIAKGLSSGYLPIGAVVVGDRIVEGLEQGGDFNHGYTYSGHPACAAAAIANIELMQRERIVEIAGERIAPYFQSRLQELAEHPFVGQIRGVGLLGAMQLVPEKPGNQQFGTDGSIGSFCRDRCMENGLIMRAVDDAMILSPPLTISEAQIDELFASARIGIDLAHQHWLETQ